MMLTPKLKRKLVGKTNTTFKFLFIALVLLLLYFPILIIIIQSFNANGQGTDFGGFTIRWYQELFRDEALMQAIYNTITIAILATLISTVLGTLAALGINSLTKKRRQNMLLLNNVPVLNAEVVTGVSLFFIFKFIGIVIGNEYILGYWTMLIAHIFFCIPYVVLSVLPKLNEVDKNLYDAALDLGCTPRSALTKVIVPSISTGVLTGMFLAFTMSFDDFVISYLVAGEEVKNFSMWIYASQKQSGRTMAWPKAYAYNTIVSVLAILILVIYNIIVIRKQRNLRKDSFKKR
ncbi:MAG TPA: ABC transporter permease [Acholeplasmataceae bacterium]|jgi:spermidine/putrescine transport system permease protein|nr:ABC transporter permease [Acholeplasmataceae bacterium]